MLSPELDGDDAPDFKLPSTSGAEVTLSETLEAGPTVVLTNRGHWCSFCVEQLATFSRVYEDLHVNDGVDVLPAVTSERPELVEMRDRFDLRFQLLADPGGAVAEQYAGTYVVDEDGGVRHEQVADHPADRTYGNWVRYFIRNDYTDMFA